jgi:hypothetical protein
VEASSGEKRAGTHLGDVGSRLFQFTRPVREHAQLVLDADAQPSKRLRRARDRADCQEPKNQKTHRLSVGPADWGALAAEIAGSSTLRCVMHCCLPFVTVSGFFYFLHVRTFWKKRGQHPHGSKAIKSTISMSHQPLQLLLRRSRLDQRSRRPLRYCFGAYIGRGVVEVKVGRIGNGR